MDTIESPIELEFKSALKKQAKRITPGKFQGFESIRTFTSYSFDKNILTPASAFRFTAPGIDKDVRQAIRSGDMVDLLVKNKKNDRLQLACGFVDETDTHIAGSSVEYVITGRDTIAQLVDNASVDKENKIVRLENADLNKIMHYCVANTRLPKQVIFQNAPNGTFLFQINPGETKINSLQRYLEFANCLVWANRFGQAVVGKPNFAQKPVGKIIVSRKDPDTNNVLEARVRRNFNTAIRQIVVVLQALGAVDMAPYTILNSDEDVSERRENLVGRSILRTFTYGEGETVVNLIKQVGNGTGSPQQIGQALAFRDIARENMKVLDVEVVVQGHINENNLNYDIDQVYDVKIEDDDVSESLYVYGCTYNLTTDHGATTTLRLCRLHTIVGYGEEFRRYKTS